MERLLTKNVSLDTNFFISQNFLDGYLIKEMANLAATGVLRIYITDIVFREVLRNFNEGLDRAKQKNEKRQIENLYILKNLKKYDAYFALPEIDVEEASYTFSGQLSTWLFKHKIEIIPTDDLKVGAVLKNYFDGKPPFEEKKKHEFPDAFSLAALENYFAGRKEKCYLISSDKGIREYSSTVILADKEAKDILSVIVKSKENAERIKFIEEKFKTNKIFIEQKAHLALYNQIKAHVQMLAAIDDRTIGAVENVSIGSLKITDMDIVHIDDGTFNIVCSIAYKAEALVHLNYGYKIGDAGIPIMDSRFKIKLSTSSFNDLAIRGYYDMALGSIEFKFFSVAPINQKEHVWSKEYA